MEARRKLRTGIDPISERFASQNKPKRMTVAEAIALCFKARQAELKGDGKAGRWMSPLSTIVLPAIGKLAIQDVDQHVLKRVLEPVWHDKPDSARKAMNRISLTMKHAAALGLEVDLQSTMKARALLGKQRHDVKHIPSMPWTEAPAFYDKLCDKADQMTCLALRFLMLSALRTSELRFARHTDIAGD